MNPTKDLLHQILNPEVSANERARLRCELAKLLEEARNFEAAREAMGELWQRVGERPNLEGLDQLTVADVLLRSGAFTGYIGSTKQIASSQGIAKDLISESMAVFQSLNDAKKVAEAKMEIAVCYAREGQLDNARVMLSEAVSRLDEEDGDLYRRALLRSAISQAARLLGLTHQRLHKILKNRHKNLRHVLGRNYCVRARGWDSC